MSRTDKDAPHWVRSLHAHWDGRSTEISHSPHCEDHPEGPRPHARQRVLRVDAEAHGWVIFYDPHRADVVYSPEGSDVVYAFVPVEPHPCDRDSSRDARCGTWINDRTRWYCGPPSVGEIHSDYYGPERAAVRDSLRDAVKEFRATGDVLDADPPTRQTRRSTWAGDYWD